MKGNTKTKRAPTPVRALKNSAKALDNASLALEKLQLAVADLQTLVQTHSNGAAPTSALARRKPGRQPKATASVTRRPRKQNGGTSTTTEAGTLI